MISDNAKLRQQSLSVDEKIRIVMNESNIVIRISMLNELLGIVPKVSVPYIQFLIKKYKAKLMDQQSYNSDLPF